MRRIVVLALALALGAGVFLIGGRINQTVVSRSIISIMKIMGYGPRPLTGMSDQQVRVYALNMLAAQGLVSDGVPARIVMLHRGAAGLADAEAIEGPGVTKGIKIPMEVVYQGHFDMKRWNLFMGSIRMDARPVYPYVGLTFDESNGMAPSMDGWPSAQALRQDLPDPELSNLP